MENLPKIVKKVTLPIEIKSDSYLQDHCFQGKAVLPAVEAMQMLASSVLIYLPHAEVALIRNARFDKFLHTGAAAGSLTARNEIEICADGRLISRLITRSKSQKAAITRVIEHVTVQFGGKKDDTFPLPIDFVSALEGVCFDIPADRLYRDLVPFGPAYQNVEHHVFMSKKGAVANLKGVDMDGSLGPLGSPFPLDAAFHVACAWGQRYSGIVGFPVGFDKRLIYSPTNQGQRYICRIMPAQPCTANRLKFNIWIYDQSGILKEEILGLQMKDVSGGRLSPPQWIANGAEEDTLELINSRCTALSVIELKAINSLAEKALSDRETDRFKKMGIERGKSYLGARLCCKRIFRQLSGDDRQTPASAITTVSPDGIRPCCPVKGKDSGAFCSVSHDSRFAIAVASHNPIGVDVEEISEKVLKSRRLYMNEKERALVKSSSLGDIEASIRIWTTKEAVSKALGISLAESWKRVSVKDIGISRSMMEIDTKDHTAFHDAIDNHLFTIVNMG